MFKKSLFIMMVCILSFTVVLAGCTKKSTDTPEASVETTPVASTQSETTPAPSVDGLAKKVSIRLMENGWVNTSPGENDPIKQWIDSKYNVDFTLENLTADTFEQKLLVSFASADEPDMISSGISDPILKLYKQGVLLDDWTPYLDKLPSVVKRQTDIAKALATSNGKLFALPIPPGVDTWSVMVRKDWMDNLGLTAPATTEEFLELIRKFTLEDPDKNGKNDTWGISSAGNNQTIGEINNFEGMFGPVSGDEGTATYYISTDGKVTNNIITGDHKLFLDFMRTLVKEKLIDPDWYTQEWEQRKPKTFSGKFGVAWYPPGAILAESESFNKDSGESVNQWINIAMPKGSDRGGKRPPVGLVNSYLTISAKAAEDPVKLERILKLIEETTFPNPGYDAVKLGVGVPGVDQTLTDLGNGTRYFNTSKESDFRVKVQGGYDYGKWLATEDGVAMGSTEQPSEITKKGLEMEAISKKYPAYTNLNALITLNPQITSDLEKMVREFDIKYILGNTDDYEGFKANWLKKGQALIDEATTQLKTQNVIK